LFSAHEHILTPQTALEWELDVILRTQLTSFPANWNLGNSVLPVTTYLFGLMHTLHCKYRLIDLSECVTMNTVSKLMA